jgi:hypothetical protein
MKKKQGHGKKARTDTPVEELSKKDTIEHYNAIMIEELNSKIDIVIDGLEATKRELRGEISAFRTEVNNRFDMVEAAIKCNADGIRELKTILDRTIIRVDDHEERLERVEKAL